MSMNSVSISRRRFAQIVGLGTVAAMGRQAFALTSPAPAIAAPVVSTNGFVRLSANENPFGPSAKALQAMVEAHGLSNRYPDSHEAELIDALGRLNGVSSNQILLGDGSGEILKLAACAFTGPAGSSRGACGSGPLVAADPTFEAILNHAAIGGAEVIKVPLTSTYSHDLEKMGAAAQKGGLVYICNPNNPTASITQKSELRTFIEKTPPDTRILVDEAYFHYADNPDYASVIPLVEHFPNLIVARTFSKIYGMAGLRCGYAVAQSATIERMRKHEPWDSVNIMAITAALASLSDGEQVINGQRQNKENRAFTVAELEKLGHKQVPSQANFIMFDVGRPVVPVIKSMKERKVEVGRLFPAMPNHMRLTIGKRSEMETFLTEFKQVMKA